MINPVGVTIRKKINPIIIGATKFPKNIPKLNHILFTGVNTLDSSNPNKRKIIDMAIKK